MRKSLIKGYITGYSWTTVRSAVLTVTLSILTIITTQSEMSQIHAYLYVGFTGSGKRGCVRDLARDEISRGEVSRDFHRRPTGLVDNRRLLATRRDETLTGVVCITGAMND